MGGHGRVRRSKGRLNLLLILLSLHRSMRKIDTFYVWMHAEQGATTTASWPEPELLAKERAQLCVLPWLHAPDPPGLLWLHGSWSRPPLHPHAGGAPSSAGNVSEWCPYTGLCNSLQVRRLPPITSYSIRILYQLCLTFFSINIIQ